MATIAASLSPQQATAMEPTSSSGDPSPETKLAYFNLALTLLLHRWPALTTAVQNSWGGPDSAGKRDWLAGVLSDLIVESPETDEDDVQDVLLQVMDDEFDVRLEDGSEDWIAAEICRFRRICGKGDFREVVEMQRNWDEKQRMGGATAQAIVRGSAKDEDEEWNGDSEDDDEDDEGGVGIAEEDTTMEDAPALVPTKERPPPPEVDDDGFTKVIGKKKR